MSVAMVVMDDVMVAVWLMSIVAAMVIACIVRNAKRYKAVFKNVDLFIYQ